MSNYQNYIGIDVSKATLDLVVVSEKKKIFTAKTTNDPKVLAKQLKKNGILLEKSLFALNTQTQRKLKKGKHIMSIMNAVRNKLLHIICACVRTGQKYEENYTLKLA